MRPGRNAAVLLKSSLASVSVCPGVKDLVGSLGGGGVEQPWLWRAAGPAPGAWLRLLQDGRMPWWLSVSVAVSSVSQSQDMFRAESKRQR